MLHTSTVVIMLYYAVYVNIVVTLWEVHHSRSSCPYPPPLSQALKGNGNAATVTLGIGESTSKGVPVKHQSKLNPQVYSEIPAPTPSVWSSCHCMRNPATVVWVFSWFLELSIHFLCMYSPHERLCTAFCTIHRPLYRQQ